MRCVLLPTPPTALIEDIGPFDPTDIVGCVHWLRADLGTQVLLGGVTNWSDQSGTGDPNKNMVSGAPLGVGFGIPTLNASDANYNNKPTISFAAALDQYFISAGSYDVQAPTQYTVFFVGNTGTIASSKTMYAQGAGDMGLNNLLTHLRAVANSVNLASSAATISTAPFVSMNRFAATTVVNISALTPDASGGGAATVVPLGANKLYIGTTSGLATFLNGTIAEYIVYNSFLNDDDSAAVMQYLGSRYNITIGA